MFRLIKLAMYAFIGYTIYELYQGMSTGRSGSFGGGQRGYGGRGRDWGRATSGSQGRMGTLTGGGEGEDELSLDNTGASASHRVGRGVTST